jgi:predicted unusual protein kinase regulating ubiquinone biosynthesis (AarF/ABC1/UbiB family)
MGFLHFARTYRSIGRLGHILGALARHGFGDLIDRLNLAHYVPGVKALRDLPGEDAKLPREEAMARRLRVVMEELGPTYRNFPVLGLWLILAILRRGRL